MENLKVSPGEKRSQLKCNSELASEFLFNLYFRLLFEEISSVVFPELLDNLFRNPIVLKNNIVWAQAIRNITEHTSTEDMAASFELTLCCYAYCDSY